MLLDDDDCGGGGGRGNCDAGTDVYANDDVDDAEGGGHGRNESNRYSDYSF